MSRPDKTRSGRIQKIREELRGRRLVWFGTRGTDADSIGHLPELSHVFSLICPPERADHVEQYCVEREKHVRVDLNRYSLEEDGSIEVRILRERMLSVLTKPSVLIAYRPNQFVDSVVFPRSQQATYWGLFHLLQMQFEHKPWVESSLHSNGVRVLPWRYYGDDELQALQDAVREGLCPHVLRVSRSTGGAGIQVIAIPSDLANKWPAHPDGFLSIAPFLHPNVSVSINGCVYADGDTVLFGPSVQLVGLRICTHRQLAYCGSDFGAVRNLDTAVLGQIEDATQRVGRWLGRNRYCGAFGVDFVIHDEKVYFAEVNPRFLASSPLVAIAAEKMEISDVYIEHMAALAGLAPIRHPPLAELAKQQPALSQVICYNRGSVPLRRSPGVLTAPEGIRVSEIPPPDVAVEPEGELFKCVVEGSITLDGHGLVEDVEEPIESLIRQWIHGSTP